MLSMKQKIGIVTENPSIASAIMDKVLLELDFEDQPSFVLYSRDFPTNKEFGIYESTALMRQLDAQITVFPELNLDSIKDLHNRLPIATSALTEPVSSTDDINVDIWADFIVQMVRGTLNKDDIDIIAENKTLPSQRVQMIAKDPNRHQGGMVAIHGGLGHEAGLLSFDEVSSKHKGAVVLNSQGNVPNESDYIIEAVVNEGLNIDLYKSPANMVADSRQKINAIKPDAIFMACNTMHWFEPQIYEKTGVDTINIVEAGLKSVPETGDTIKLLALSTNGSAAGRIFSAARDAVGRTDIEIIYPTKTEQLIMDGAIFGDIIEEKNVSNAAEKFQKILDNHPCDGVLLGCTEVVFGLDKMNGLPEIIVDNAIAAANEAVAAAKEISAGREDFWTRQKIHLTNGETKSKNISTMIQTSNVASR
jgi:aspartate/glutamate racemase